MRVVARGIRLGNALDFGKITGHVGRSHARAHADGKRVVSVFSLNQRLRGRHFGKRHAEGRGIPLLRTVKQPEGCIVHSSRRIGIRGAHIGPVGIQRAYDMIAFVRIDGLPVSHPEADGNLGGRLGVNGIQRILAVVTEGAVVRISQPEYGLKPPLRRSTEIDAHLRKGLPGRARTAGLQAIGNIPLLRLPYRMHIMEVIPAGIPGRVVIGANQQILRGLRVRHRPPDHRLVGCHTRRTALPNDAGHRQQKSQKGAQSPHLPHFHHSVPHFLT